MQTLVLPDRLKFGSRLGGQNETRPGSPRKCISGSDDSAVNQPGILFTCIEATLIKHISCVVVVKHHAPGIIQQRARPVTPLAVKVTERQGPTCRTAEQSCEIFLPFTLQNFQSCGAISSFVRLQQHSHFISLRDPIHPRLSLRRGTRRIRDTRFH